MNYKDLDKNDEEAVKKAIEEAIEKMFPKQGDPDYWGPVGAGWYKLGRQGYCGQGGWDMLKDCIKKQANEKSTGFMGTDINY